MRPPFESVIAQGSTPTVTIFVVEPIPFEAISKWEIAFIQNHKVVLTKSGDEVEVDNDLRRLSTNLTQQETLELDSRFPCFVQAKALTSDGGVIPTTLAPVPIYRVEHKEVMDNA